MSLMCLSDTDTLAVLHDPEDRMHSGGDILQDCISEHSSLTKTESDPQGNLSLPGEKSFHFERTKTVKTHKQEENGKTRKEGE